MSVKRDETDTRLPKDYKKLDGFWKAQGFKPTAIFTTLDWPELDRKKADQKHTLEFWTCDDL